MYPKIELPSAKQALSTAASLAATAMLVRSFARDLFPPELRHLLFTKVRLALNALSREVTLVIDEHDGLGRNQLFHAAELYTSAIAGPTTRALRASLPEKEKKILITVGKNEEVADSYRGVKVKWRMVATVKSNKSRSHPDEYGRGSKIEIRHLELIFDKNHKNLVIDEYLPYVVERSKAVKEAKKTLKLHTLANDGMHGSHRSPWRSVVLDHPANFQTLAMDDEIKSMVIEDLDRFLKKKELYRRVGKAWKRGYLLFGPPGTGKSSLIAAIANHLNFDVYDLELTDIRSNSSLRRLLLWTENRSILVVEDIDASIDLSERNSGMKKTMPMMDPYGRNQGQKVTLSGLLNFIDGLWSSCGDERITIFTTNHKDKLDPALLRPGRMDLHIHMSYCTPSGFRLLANNYLGLTDHPLGSKARLLIASAQVTPAEVGEQLLKSDDPTIALKGLIKFLEEKKEAGRENFETSNEEKREGKDGVGLAGHDEILKRAKEASEKMGKGILKKDEVANALKILIGFLEEEIGEKKAEDSDTRLGSSAATVVESSAKTVVEFGKQDVAKTE